MKQILIFANGDVNDGPMVRKSLKALHHPLVVAADGGARAALYFGYLPKLVIGDLDSLSGVEVHNLRTQGVEIRRYPAEKNETDLELALLYSAEAEADQVRIVGGVGDRLDQTIANMYLLALPELAGRDVAFVAGRQVMFLLRPGEHDISGAPGDTISLIPLGGEVKGIRTEGLYYPLKDETLAFGPARGVSNVLNQEQAKITLREGVLLIVHTVGRA
ncbi:MAG TPA: thiamine diphosphokinase [Phototrophicaceae bacterium]|jgi:thiamine pyrophosphokinase|nr:thiamine diphosphokinase [Phototrophicaceae bacterium]